MRRIIRPGKVASGNEALEPRCRPLRLILATVTVATLAMLGPASAGATGQTDDVLLSVSCATSTFCVATGQGTIEPNLLEHWNGHKWSTMRAAARHDILSGVACLSPGACIAVGMNSSSVGPSSEKLVTRRWSKVPIVGSSGGVASSFEGVSCSQGSCFALGTEVGRPITGEHGSFFASRPIDTTSWSIEQSVVNPTAFVYLTSLSCISAEMCVGVGSYQSNPLGTAQTLAEAWNGSSWSEMAIPSPGTSSQLSSVSCVSAMACTAVGNSDGNPLIENWDGTSWSVASAPPTNGSLYGVSCPGSSTCLAVGSSSVGPIGLAWDGSAWAALPVPMPTGFTSGQLLSVSCTSDESCMTVGSSTTSDKTISLAESWNGSSLRITPTPSP